MKFVETPFVVVDGGLSTALEQLGADISGPLWTANVVINDQTKLLGAHRAFVDAGAEIITTASYQCGMAQFESCGLSATRARQALYSTTQIAQRAVQGTSTRVAISIGPFGACRADGSEYTGRYQVDWQEVENYHRAKLEVLVDSGADMIAVETIPLAGEARLIAEILQDLGAPPAWFSFGFADTRTTYGRDSVADAVGAVEGYDNLLAVGMNCTHPFHVQELLSAMAALVPGLALVAYPNHGRIWDDLNRCWVGDSHGVRDAVMLQNWMSAGARFIGGCCGVDPASIAQLADFKISHS